MSTEQRHPFADVHNWMIEEAEKDFRDVLNLLVKAADDDSQFKWGKIAVAVGQAREVLERHPKGD